MSVFEIDLVQPMQIEGCSEITLCTKSYILTLSKSKHNRDLVYDILFIY